MTIRLSLPFVAALPATPALAESPATTDLGGSLFSMLFGLAIVIALLFASLWLLRQLSQPRGAGAGLLRVIAATAVGSRERVVVVELGKTCLVVGVAPGQVTALAQFPRDELPTTAAPADAGFAGRLRQALDRHAR